MPEGTENDRAVLRRPDEQEPDVRMLAQRRKQVRVPLLDLLERQPPLLLHQVHEPEIARAENDDLRSDTSFFARFVL